MAQTDNYPDRKTRQRRQHRQDMAPHHPTVLNGQNDGKIPAAQIADTYPYPPCSTWLSAEKHDMHGTVDDHR